MEIVRNEFGLYSYTWTCVDLYNEVVFAVSLRVRHRSSDGVFRGDVIRGAEHLPIGRGPSKCSDTMCDGLQCKLQVSKGFYGRVKTVSLVPTVLLIVCGL